MTSLVQNHRDLWEREDGENPDPATWSRADN